MEFCWTLGIEALPSQQIWNPCLSSGLYTGGLGTFTILSSKKWIHTPMTGGLIHWQLDQIFYSLGIKFWSVNLIIWKWRRWSSRALFGHKKLSGRVTTRSERICPKIGYPTSSSQSSPHPFITSWQFSADSTATSSGSLKLQFYRWAGVCTPWCRYWKHGDSPKLWPSMGKMMRHHCLFFNALYTAHFMDHSLGKRKFKCLFHLPL